MKSIRILPLLLAATWAQAAVQPAGVFTDQAVLQRDAAVRLWGTAAPGEEVTVRFAGQVVSATAGSDGKWLLALTPMAANATGQALTFAGSATPKPVVLNKVLVGEVWLAGGQSNMASTMGTYCKVTQPDIDSAKDPLLRMVTIPGLDYAGQNQRQAEWLDSVPGNVENFSATAYYFAKHLRKTMNVPVGIISCNVGSTPAEAWMSREMLSSKPDLKRILDTYDEHVKTAFKDEADYLAREKAYRKASGEFERTKGKGKRQARPQPVVGPHYRQRPCGLYDNMLTQTIPYTIRGVIWYQGEANANAAAGFHYRSVFSALIEGWREVFQNPKMPFLFVQLATYGSGKDQAAEWPELRESQAWVEQHVPNTGMVVLVDGGEEKSIHPHSKDKAGLRLGLLARHQAYGEQDLLCHGPMVDSSQAKGAVLELSFKAQPSALVLQPAEGNAFEVCGADGKYVPAQAELKDGKILLTAEGVTAPQYARYGWHKWFVPTLFNAGGLPAGPFRTDDFSAESADRYYLDFLKQLEPRPSPGPAY